MGEPRQNQPQNSPALTLLAPGTLLAKAAAQTQQALACGALQSIPTEAEWVEQQGIRFLVRILANVARKEAATKAQTQQITPSGKPFNPFLPYDPDLFVADLSETHVCLLNKYNVVDHHLLIITRAFEAQENLLNLADLAALWTCLVEIDGLGFYNSNQLAGASQPHKHLQFVPLPLVPGGEPIPIEGALAKAEWQGLIGTSPVLPFQHAVVRLNWDATTSPQQAAQITLEAYHYILTMLHLNPASEAAYNLLITRKWLLIVPRTQEQFESISVNSLGFAGTLFVRDLQQFERLKRISPLALLTGVAVAKAGV